MSLSRRLDEVEHNLSPREAVIRWMREAHAFESLGNYFRWLLDQPDDVYPLLRMPAQVVGAVKARNKGVPDVKLRSEFYRVQKDVLFLYFLHDQANARALMDRESLSLRVIILIKEIRALINERHTVDQLRLERVDLTGKKHGRAGKVERSTQDLYRAHVQSWLPEAEGVRIRILEFLSAAERISRRYFAGADILYPDIRKHLIDSLETISSLKDMYVDLLLASRRSDDQFRDYVLALLEAPAEPREPGLAGEFEETAPDVTEGAKALAEQWMLMAKSETLQKLGEERAAESLAEQLVREHMR